MIQILDKKSVAVAHRAPMRVQKQPLVCYQMRKDFFIRKSI